ncbi:hypothetical protein SIIN_9250_T [Serendipita indica DSM 11827]|nr:hypothetical protein SIIN_9250_T [Serendipita indica DSM 11827]
MQHIIKSTTRFFILVVQSHGCAAVHQLVGSSNTLELVVVFETANRDAEPDDDESKSDTGTG